MENFEKVYKHQNNIEVIFCIQFKFINYILHSQNLTFYQF